MMKRSRIIIVLLSAFAGVTSQSIAWADSASFTAPGQSAGQTAALENIIVRLLAAEEAQNELVADMKLTSELIERRLNDDGSVKTEKRFSKEIYFARSADTTSKRRVHEKYLAYFVDGELQDADELADAVAEKIEKRKKRRGHDLSSNLTDVFREKHRDAYDCELRGVEVESLSKRPCYAITVRAKENDPKDRINATMWIDTASTMLVRADFVPAKLPSNMMFKLKTLTMSMRLTPDAQGIWAPSRFELDGKATAGLFFGVNFRTVETYGPPQINSGVSDSLFATVMGM